MFYCDPGGCGATQGDSVLTHAEALQIK